MHTLLLRLAGPMQSWGVQSRFGVRDTGREPSKSGVIGLVCAALGRPRQAALDDLAALQMGVRSDCEGSLEVDYHTAQNVLKAGGGIKDTELSNRYYLADAAFLAGLEGQHLTLLEEIHAALRDPHWPLYLGRKAFVPGAPVWLADGLHRGQDLLEALTSYPYLGSRTPAEGERLRLVLEDPLGEIIRPDTPLSFAERTFAPRRVKIVYVEAPDSILEAP